MPAAATPFGSLIKALAKEIGIPEAAVSGDGIFRVEIEDMPLSIINTGEYALLYSSLGSLPVDKAAAESARVLLLSGNVLFRGTGGPALGVAPEDGAITLCWQITLQGLSEMNFLEKVENFLDVAHEWAARLDNAEKAGAGPQSASTPPADGSWTSV